MAGFRRVLCASDLSEAADWAIRAADREARWHGAELVVLHALPLNYPGAPMSPESAEQVVVQQEELASEIIDELLERVERLTGRDAGQVSVMVEPGTPDETIIEQADEVGADLIVVGALGRSEHRPRLFGSVAEKVVKRAHVSVLVARPGGETGRIVLGTDFSSPAEPAARLAADEVVRRCAGITVVHSIELVSPEFAMGEPAAIPPIALGAYPIAEMREAAQKRLAATLVHLGIAGEIAVMEGPPGEAIVRLAAEKHADLIVIGTSGRTGLDRLLLGSVAVNVVREAPCSVLVARPPAQPRRKTGLREQVSAAS
ncbi:MAG TPA: universal stress protein [Polyangia bacterium]|nr:universal stress protein [Polyangia bacterium]